MRKIFLWIISIPFFIVLVIGNLFIIPVALLFSPIWALMDLIDVLKGEKSEFLNFIIPILFMGILTWMDMVNIDPPKWMSRD